MKKRKFNLLLNIATLCLCVAAIAFGVYSAKTASLNVSGTVAFTAHNCKADVIAKVYGDAVNSSNEINADGTPRQAENAGQVGNWSVDGKDVNNVTMTKFYFSDMGENDVTPITLTFTITNQSDFPIQACITSISATSVGFYNFDSTTTYSPNTYVQMDAKGNTANLVVVLKLTDLTITVVSDLEISLKFEKYTPQFTIDTITEEVYLDTAWVKTTTQKLVTTMGHSIVGSTAEEGTDGLTETPIRWYAFAVKGEGDSYTKPSFVPDSNVSITTGTNEIWYSLYNVDMSKVTNYKNHTYWFIQEYVVAGGYKINDNDSSSQKGIIFNPDSGDNYNSIYAQIDSTNASNSKKSTIYTFLEGNEEKSFATKTGITQEELNKIDSRSVDESYDVTFTDGDAKDGKLACQFSSKFWLINHAELGLLCNQSVGISDYDYKVKTYGINNQDVYTSGSTVYGASWWLRSPYAGYYFSAHFVYNSGYFGNDDVSNGLVGVRAAFQIQI